MTSPTFLKRLYVFGFRGVRSELTLDFGRRLTIVAGGNATGKSSIVQAIQYTLTGEVMDQYNKPIQNDYLRHLSAATSGQVRLSLTTAAFAEDGDLSASTSETRSQIRNRASARLVRDWSGAGEPPFTITHLTSQELLSELLSPDTRLSKNNVASLFSDSYLRQMARRAEVLTDYCRRLAHGDNSRSALMKLTDRLESAKAFRDGLAVTLALPSGTRKAVERQIIELAQALGVNGSGHEMLPLLRNAVKESEDGARKRIADVRFVGTLVVGLAASETELAVTQQTQTTLAADEQQLRQKADNLASTVHGLQQREASVSEALQRARRVVDSGAAYELWTTRLKSLSESLADASKTVDELQTRISFMAADRAQSQKLLTSQNEALIKLVEQRADVSRQLVAIKTSGELPLADAAAEILRLGQQLESAQRDADALDLSIAGSREQAGAAKARYEQARVTLGEASAAVLRASAAVKALADIGTNSECPLCGHHHGSVDQLSSAIDRVRRRRAEQLDASQQAADAAKNLVDIAESRLDSILARRTAQERETEDIQQRLAHARGQLTALEERRRHTLATAGLPEDLSDLTLEERATELQIRSDRMVAESDELTALRDQTQAIDLKHSSRATSLKAQFDQAIRTRDQVDRALQEHRLFAPDAIGADAVAEAQRQVRDVSAASQEVQTQLALALSQQTEIAQNTQAVRVRMAGVRETIRQLEERIGQAKAAIEERGITDPTATALAVEESGAAAVLARATQRREQLKAVEDYFSGLDAAERLQAADDTVASAAAELKKHQSSLTRFEGYRHQFQGLYDELLQRQNSLAESMLETTAEPCRQLFQAMTAGCPWPLVFKLEDDRIVARLGTANNAARAASILNASYFNVAAVALRLALAAHQTWSHLRTAVFDDPILEMDNLTQAALIDGLESVLTSTQDPWSNLQLVLTTWSEEFALMASHKLAHLNETATDNCVVYQLESDPSGSPTAARFTPHWARRTSAA